MKICFSSCRKMEELRELIVFLNENQKLICVPFKCFGLQ